MYVAQNRTSLEHENTRLFDSANTGNPTAISVLPKNTVPAPATWFEFDEELYSGDVVCFYDQLRDRDGFGLLEDIIEKNGRDYARITETKVWLRGRYMQDGVLYEYGDVYEETIEVVVELVYLADEMLNEDDPFYCVNYNVEAV